MKNFLRCSAILLLIVMNFIELSCLRKDLYYKTRDRLLELINLNQAPPVRHSLWVTDGAVYATALSGNTLYIGGQFSNVFPNVRYGAPLDPATGVYQAGAVRTVINGSVLASTPDGSGGWYIGGNFTEVNGQTRYHIARINTDGSLHPWDPDVGVATSWVNAIVEYNGIVYFGGSFGSINNNATALIRTNIAAVSAATAIGTSWDPNANGQVLDIKISNNKIYFVGVFNTVSAITRNRAAAFDINGSIDAWDPNIAGASANKLAIDGSTIYIGGEFGSINAPLGVPKNNIAAVDSTTGTNIGSFIAETNLPVATLEVSGGTLYIGGEFTLVNLLASDYIAALDKTNGNLIGTWSPSVSGTTVNSIVQAGNAVYFGGTFSDVNGSTRNCIAAVEAVGSANPGQILPFNPSADSPVQTLSISGNSLFAGGSFNAISRLPRLNCAALDITTGMPAPWIADAAGSVRALHATENLVYLGGYFNTVNGTARYLIAAVDAFTGAVTGWDPGLTIGGAPSVRTIASSPGRVYLGGQFTLGTYQNVVALDASSALPVWPAPVSWDIPNIPIPSAFVEALYVNGNRLYLGGSFTSLGSDSSRNYIAAMDADTGVVDTASFLPTAPTISPGPIHALALSNGLLYFGGNFTGFGSPVQHYIAAVDAVTGADAHWSMSADWDVLALSRYGDLLYAGGASGFTTLWGTPSNLIGAVSTLIPSVKNGAFLPNFGAGSTISTLLATEGVVFAGGQFSQSGTPLDNWSQIVALDPNTGNPLR